MNIPLVLLPPWRWGRAITLELIRDDHPWHVLQALEQRVEKLPRRVLIASALHEHIEHVIVLIHGVPQVMPLTIDGQENLVQMPFVARLKPPPSQPIGVVLPKLPTPLADRLVGHRDTAFEEDLFHVAVAQGEATGEPDAVADDFARKAVVLVTLGVGRRGHAWLPILMCNRSWREDHRGHHVME
jgi:hypothetical protein